MHFETPVNAAWAKKTFELPDVEDGAVHFATRGQTHPKQFIKALHMMFERVPGDHFLHNELISPEVKKHRDDKVKQEEIEKKQAKQAAKQPKLADYFSKSFGEN